MENAVPRCICCGSHYDSTGRRYDLLMSEFGVTDGFCPICESSRARMVLESSPVAPPYLKAIYLPVWNELSAEGFDQLPLLYNQRPIAQFYQGVSDDARLLFLNGIVLRHRGSREADEDDYEAEQPEPQSDQACWWESRKVHLLDRQKKNGDPFLTRKMQGFGN